MDCLVMRDWSPYSAAPRPEGRRVLEDAPRPSGDFSPSYTTTGNVITRLGCHHPTQTSSLQPDQTLAISPPPPPPPPTSPSTPPPTTPPTTPPHPRPPPTTATPSPPTPPRFAPAPTAASPA